MCGSCLMIARINRTNSMCVALDFVMFNFLEKTTNFAQLLQKNEGLARFRGVLYRNMYTFYHRTPLNRANPSFKCKS